jgi:hypothetical protein
MENNKQIPVLKVAVRKGKNKQQYILRKDKPFNKQYEELIQGSDDFTCKEEHMLESEYLKITKA